MKDPNKDINGDKCVQNDDGKLSMTIEEKLSGKSGNPITNHS